MISLSIVATETSTLTLIGVPALAYGSFARPEQGGSFTYLQVVVGYLIGRVVISAVLLPAYFAREHGITVRPSADYSGGIGCWD